MKLRLVGAPAEPPGFARARLKIDGQRFAVEFSPVGFDGPPAEEESYFPADVGVGVFRFRPLERRRPPGAESAKVLFPPADAGGD